MRPAASASIAIGLDPLVHVGDVVELTGRATMGGSAPIVLRETLRILSSGARRRRRSRITAADVAAGRHQYLFVEAAGIVRSASMDSRGRLALTLRTDGEDLSVGVREVGRADPAQYLDAGVTHAGRPGHQPRRLRPHRPLAAAGLVDARDHHRPPGADRGRRFRCSRCRRW